MERLSMMSGPNRAMVGEPAPRFTCKAIIDGRIKEISSRTIMANNQWLILIFFPAAWSFICPTEIIAFSAQHHEFSQRGAALLFASTDSEYVLKAWNATTADEGGLGGVHVALLSDRSHRLARDYGVLVEEEGVAQRAVFVVDPRGIIRSVGVYDASVGRSVDEVRRCLDALRFSDEFGVGCPVDWKAGEPGISDPDARDPNASPAAVASGMVHSRRSYPEALPAGSKAALKPSPPVTPSHRPAPLRGLSWGAAAWARNAAANAVNGGARPKSLGLPAAGNEQEMMGIGMAVTPPLSSSFSPMMGLTPQRGLTPSGREKGLFWGNGMEEAEVEAVTG